MTETFIPTQTTGPLNATELATITRWVADREADEFGLTELDANRAEFIGRRMAYWEYRLRTGRWRGQR